MTSVLTAPSEPQAAHTSSSGTAAAQWAVGEVVDADGDGTLFYVSVAGRVHEARRALGCVVNPALGDSVALLLEGQDRPVHLIQVLARASAAQAVWSSPGGLTIRSDQDLTLEASASLNARGRQFNGRFDEVNWVTRWLGVRADEFIGHSRVGRWIGDALEMLGKSLRVSADRSYRHVGDVDQVRVGVYDLKATDVVHMRSKHVLVKAKELAKVDGAQIHIG